MTDVLLVEVSPKKCAANAASDCADWAAGNGMSNHRTPDTACNCADGTIAAAAAMGAAAIDMVASGLGSVWYSDSPRNQHRQNARSKCSAHLKFSFERQNVPRDRKLPDLEPIWGGAVSPLR